MKSGYEQADLQKALILVISIRADCERIQPNFAEGSPQRTLLKNRIKALRISEALISGDSIIGKYSIEELREALKPVSSIISKCEKSQIKFESETTQHTRLENMILAMGVAKSLIENEIRRQEEIT